MRNHEAEIVEEFRVAIFLHATWPRYPLRRRLRSSWWKFADAYTRGRGAVPVAEVNTALYSQVGSVWTPFN